MKRFAAIFFLGLLLFNTAGYRLLFDYFEQRAKAQLIASVEQEQYDAADLITLTVPLSLPYQMDWSDWEQVRGEIEIDGVTYQYVQRKVEHGKMILQCLPNKQQAKIESARDHFFHLANSFQADNSGKKGHSSNAIKITKPALTDFDDHWSCWGIPPYTELTKQLSFNLQSFLPQSVLPVPAQPPEIMA